MNAFCTACQYLLTKVCGYKCIIAHNGYVRQHTSQSRNEKEENREIALYLANKYGYEIDLIPKVDEVAGMTNADSFNHTLGYKQEYKVISVGTFNAIDQAVRKGAKQANSLVLFFASGISLSLITQAFSNRVRQAPHLAEIHVIIDGKDALFSRQSILVKAFKIQQGDFK